MFSTLPLTKVKGVSSKTENTAYPNCGILYARVRQTASWKHAYIILTPLEPHFYTVKLGFTGVYIIFLISALKHRLWVLVRTAIYILSRSKKNITIFHLNIFVFSAVKFTMYLYRRVFVMGCFINPWISCCVLNLGFDVLSKVKYVKCLIRFWLSRSYHEGGERITSI